MSSIERGSVTDGKNEGLLKLTAAGPFKQGGFALLLLILTIAAYWNSFTVPMVFDDRAVIQQNSAVRFGMNPMELGGRPLLYATYALNYKLGGLDVRGYHIVNFVLHCANGVLLWIILWILGGSMSAFIGTAIFLLHPIQTEAVTYISGRSELLSMFLYLAGFLIMMLLFHRIRAWHSLILIAFTAFGAMSKETAVTLPFAVLVYDWIYVGSRACRFYMATFAMLAAIGWPVIHSLRGILGYHEGYLSPGSYFMTETYVIVRYLSLILWPAGQNVDHAARVMHLSDATFILSAMVLIALLISAWLLRKREPLISLGLCWFFIALAPTSSFIPLLDPIAEHRLYLPMVGMAMVLAGVVSIFELPERLPC